jgi:hypothetical protein
VFPMQEAMAKATKNEAAYAAVSMPETFQS